MPHSLVVRFASLDALEQGISSAHDDLVEAIAGIRRDVDGLLIGWQVDTESRRAQLAFDTRLGQQVEALMAALAKIRSELDATAASAHATEVRNVAVLD